MENISISKFEEVVQEKSTDKKETKKLAIELFEESGNVTSIIRRSIKGNFHEKSVDLEQLKKEIGDVLVCMVQLISQLSGASLEKIARRNLEKTHTNYSIGDFKQENTLLDFDEYQKNVTQTYREDLPQTQAEQARFFAMGLMKEIGKISELFGEYIIDGVMLNRYRIEEKLGDTLWYLVAICQTYGVSLQEIIQSGLEKMRAKEQADDEAKIAQGNENISFKEYTKGTSSTPQGHILSMNEDDKSRELILGLFEEGGEVTELCADMELNREHLKDEIGDVLWYISQIANRLPGMNLEKVARFNLEKTHTRYQKDANSITEEDLVFNEYASYVSNTYKADLPESQEERVTLFSIGLIKEIGKISELYGENRIDSKTLDVYKVKEKLGDALWYLTAIARTAGLNLGEIASANMIKTQNRKKVTEEKTTNDGNQVEI